MKCLYCDCQDTRVIDSRETGTMDAIRRRRQCIACGKRFTTYERAEAPSVLVTKRDGRVEDFDRDKLEAGLLKACQKRPIPRAALEALIEGIEETAREAGDGGPLATSRIGELVLEGLKKLDEVAYLRFASVYREFGDADAFRKEAAELLARKTGERAGRPEVPANPRAGT
ncbi:MAG TPA: transcriptional regulator NrdR [Candidatus Thermoplasmatota archaeon]|nr:transcriptional regulator NrdR [Candidatus Thermoplasmatota archaeon]